MGCKTISTSKKKKSKIENKQQHVILLRDDYDLWFKDIYFIVKDGKQFAKFNFTTDIKCARQFVDIDEIDVFLGDYDLDCVKISYHHKNTLEKITEIKAVDQHQLVKLNKPDKQILYVIRETRDDEGGKEWINKYNLIFRTEEEAEVCKEKYNLNNPNMPRMYVNKITF